MGDEQDNTEAGPASDETDTFTNRLQDVATGRVPTGKLAWSDDDQEEDEPDQQPDESAGYSWGTTTNRAAVMVATGAAVAAAVGVIGWIATHRGHDTPPQVPTSTTLAAPVAPSTVTVTAPTVQAAPTSIVVLPPLTPSPAQTASNAATADQRFLENMASYGTPVPVGHEAEAINRAHTACALVHQVSIDQVPNEMATRYYTHMLSPYQWRELQNLVSSAQLSYPNCMNAVD